MQQIGRFLGNLYNKGNIDCSPDHHPDKQAGFDPCGASVVGRLMPYKQDTAEVVDCPVATPMPCGPVWFEARLVSAHMALRGEEGVVGRGVAFVALGVGAECCVSRRQIYCRACMIALTPREGARVDKDHGGVSLGGEGVKAGEHMAGGKSGALAELGIPWTMNFNQSLFDLDLVQK